METEARGQQGWGQMLGWGGTRLALGQLLAVGTAPQRPPAYSRFVRQIKSFLISGVSPHRITGFPHIGKERKSRRLGYGKRQGTLGETQQHAHVVVGGLRGVGCAVGTCVRSASATLGLPPLTARVAFLPTLLGL